MAGPADQVSGSRLATAARGHGRTACCELCPHQAVRAWLVRAQQGHAAAEASGFDSYDAQRIPAAVGLGRILHAQLRRRSCDESAELKCDGAPKRAAPFEQTLSRPCLCVDMRAVVPADMRADIHADMCADMRADLRADLRADMCIDWTVAEQWAVTAVLQPMCDPQVLTVC